MDLPETAGVSELGIYRAPQIPNKFEIIPIHNSDRGSFKRCRRNFDWSSPARQNLSPRVDIAGINTNLWFGTGIHWALENYYTPGLSRDPVESWKTWFDIQWRGGVVTQDWLDKVYDLKPRPSKPTQRDLQIRDFVQANMPPGFVGSRVEIAPLWVVKGLEDILPDADADEYEELKELGVNMMEFYKTYAQDHDEFETLVAEHDFSIPVWDYENNTILMAIDLREQSPNYGKKLEVHARGRMDGIWVKPSGKMGIIDHKTSARIDEDFFEKLDVDEQCTSYLYAAQVEAKYYGLDYAGTIMEEVIYNVLRKTYPKPPTIVRGGLFSVDRNNESCTYDMLMEWCESQEPPIEVENLPEKHQYYVAYLRDIGDEQFIVRKHVRRNQHQLANAGYRLYLEAMDMLNPDLRIYPNFGHACKYCIFKSPCLAKESGADWEQMLEDGYVGTRDR